MSNITIEKRGLSTGQKDELLNKLKSRFDKNPDRHKGIDWNKVRKKLDDYPGKLWSLHEMERTGGEPDVVDLDRTAGEYIFCDCSAETPAGRRSLCFDQEALEERKENKPSGSATGMAEEMGIELLSEEQYRRLQELGKFDLKTSSWVQTPREIRQLGGALFCDRRYDHVFVYHNGAISYYAARGFRGMIRI